MKHLFPKIIALSVILLAVFLPANAYALDRNMPTDTIYRFIDTEPEFEGGYEGLQQYLEANLKYPPSVVKKGIHGTVCVEFVIEKDGSVTISRVLTPVHPKLDRAAVRVLKKSPKWEPGKMSGEAVRCYFIVPINFALK